MAIPNSSSYCYDGTLRFDNFLSFRGANPNALSFNNTTPLHYAVMNAHTRLITLLLSCPDIDVSLKNKEGLTAKDLAHRSATTQLKDYFNEQKRKHLVALSSLGEEKQQLEERFLQASAELEKTSQAQRIVCSLFIILVLVHLGS